MLITIVCVGKIKEKFYREAVSEYLKRLSRYTRTDVIEVQDESLPEGAPPALYEGVRQKEGERILKAIPKDSYVIALDQRGKKLDSVELSSHMQKLFNGGVSRLTFIIGGSVGMTDLVIKEADYVLSFSDMTFPHQLMRVILSEQIYRAFRIMKNEPYHK